MAFESLSVGNVVIFAYTEKKKVEEEKAEDGEVRGEDAKREVQ